MSQRVAHAADIQEGLIAAGDLCSATARQLLLATSSPRPHQKQLICSKNGSDGNQVGSLHIEGSRSALTVAIRTCSPNRAARRSRSPRPVATRAPPTAT